MLDRVIQTRKTLNNDQLKTICESSKNALLETKDIIEKAGCSIL